MTVNIGIVGAGGIARHHAKTLGTLAEAKIVSVADPDPDNGKVFADAYGARVYGDAAAMLAGEADLHAVMLAASADVRLEPIRQVCDRKLALFCEKPPALDLGTAIEARDAITQAGILNTVGFQSRWSLAATRMRELVADRPRLFARIVVAWPVFDWVKDGLAPERLYTHAGCGGPMIEQGIHYQDVLRYITDDEPVRVHAVGEIGRTQPIDGRDCEETTIVTARHASGMLSTHVHNWSHTEALLELQVVGDAFDLTWHMHESERLTGRLDGEDIDERFDADPYVEEIRGFVDAVAQNDPTILRSPYADACKTLAVCQAATRAVKTGAPQDVEDV